MRLRLFVTVLLLVPQLVFAWGKDGHEIVAATGSSLTYTGKQFWNANLQNMVKMTTVPDFYWKRGNQAKPETVTHFFQPDSYFSQPNQFNQIPHDSNVAQSQFGHTNFVNWGSAPWRINQFYQAALTALKRQDFTTAVMMAGAMSHYIGDLSQPLHVTENYDGQKTNDPGIHKFFETTNIVPNKVKLLPAVVQGAALLLKNPVFQSQFRGSVVDVAFNETFRAYSLKDQLINTDLKLGRTGVGAQKQLILARDRLADGSATLAIILSHLWEESGLSDIGASVNISVPQWVLPNYYSRAALAQSIEMSIEKLQNDDDCFE